MRWGTPRAGYRALVRWLRGIGNETLDTEDAARAALGRRTSTPTTPTTKDPRSRRCGYYA